MIRNLLVTLVIVGLVALNIATLTVSSVFAFLSELVEAVDVDSVRQSQDRRARTLTGERDRARRQLRAARTDTGMARTSAEVAKAHRSRVEREAAGRLEKHREAVERTARRVGSRMAINAGRNVSSMLLEAVPLVGIATIAGVTALELYDACEAVKDMAGTRQRLRPRDRHAGPRGEVCGLRAPSVCELTERVTGVPGG